MSNSLPYNTNKERNFSQSTTARHPSTTPSYSPTSHFIDLLRGWRRVGGKKHKQEGGGRGGAAAAGKGQMGRGQSIVGEFSISSIY